MKTILKNKTYQRVTDSDAERLVSIGAAKYAPKSKYKTQSSAPTTVAREVNLEEKANKNAKQLNRIAKLKSKQRA
jgi:hypothetical protein